MEKKDKIRYNSLLNALKLFKKANPEIAEFYVVGINKKGCVTGFSHKYLVKYYDKNKSKGI